MHQQPARSGARRGRSLLAPARSGAPVVSDLRSVRREVVFRAQTHRDAPRDHAGSMCHTTDVPRLPRRVLRPTQHAARAEPRARRAGCRIGLSAARQTYRHARAAWSPAVNRAMNRYQRSPKSANTRRNIVTCERVRIPRPIARSRTGTRRSGFGQGHAHGIPVLRDAPESQYTVRGPQLTQQCTVHTIHT